MKTVDIIIPSYKPGAEFEDLLKRLDAQHVQAEHWIIMNTEEQYWDSRWEELYPQLQVHHVTKESFNHGGTRMQGAGYSHADVMVFMTQDALPADRDLIGNLLAALEQEERIGAAYARQLPKKDCGFLERYTRAFNYPEESHVRWEADLEKFGIKTFFCSNVCAAYKRDVFDALGGFVEKAIFNEDMIYAGGLIHAGYGIAYAAGARVYHSHNYSGIAQFHRNFDLGVSQAEHPEIFADVPSEGEGIALVKRSLQHLLKTNHPELIPTLIYQSGCKYLGYLAGKHYQKLPKTLILKFTMMPSYWE
ncbi:MAG: glycosyltransferase family 2 protein [Clostridiales bacterium]|nr:glycosyltransferase family 2 protein [Candidatus Blautia equi]